MPPEMHSRSFGRRLRAGFRQVQIVREFRRPLLLFVAAIVFAGFLYSALARVAHDSDPKVEVPSFVGSLYLILSMIFLQANIAFPEPWYLELFFFVMPIIGLALLGSGVANLGTQLFNKSARGREWEMAVASTFTNHAIVVGLGKLGYRVTMHLLEFGLDVVVIEMDDQKPFIHAVREAGVPVIVADARREGVLNTAGLPRAMSIVCCTQDDLANLNIALGARELRPDIKVVLRMFDAELAQRVEHGFGIHTMFSTAALAAPAFAAAATRAQIEYSFYVDDHLLHVARMTIDAGSPMVEKTIEQVERGYDLTIVLHGRPHDHRVHPTADEVLSIGDSLVVLASLEVLDQLGLVGPHRRGKAQPVSPPPGRLRRLLGRKR